MKELSDADPDELDDWWDELNAKVERAELLARARVLSEFDIVGFEFLASDRMATATIHFKYKSEMQAALASGLEKRLIQIIGGCVFVCGLPMSLAIRLKISSNQEVADLVDQLATTDSQQ